MEEIIIKESDAIIVRERGATKHDVNLEIVKKPLERNTSIIKDLDRIDDDYYIQDYLDVKNNWLFGLGEILIVLFVFFKFKNEILNQQIVLALILFPFLIHGIYPIVKNFLSKNSKVILDRKNSLFAYPGFGLNKIIVTKFKDLVLLIVNVGKTAAPYLKAPQTKFTNFTLTAIDVLSFYVWYMDKNRPLPPGTVFDEYRERDFQRRKEEGFPSPLYPSFVPTPEATLEQQQERDQYWEERFTTDQNGETQRHFWERDSSLKVDKSQHN